MLTQTATPAEKRRRLREGLQAGRLQVFVGAYSPLVALLVEEIGFDGVYIGSSTLSADLGLPDIELITLSEAAQRGRAIAGASNLPTLLDADTGFGAAINVARTVRELEDAGLAACHIEDQVSPKRCGHLENKQIVPAAIMCEKIRAAVAARRDPDFAIVARTDARAVEGLDAAIARANEYRAAGADAIFPDALQDADEFARFAREVDAPAVANMTEFGRSPLLSMDELADLGYAIVIYPATSLRLAMAAVEDGLRQLKQDGHQRALLDRMQTRQRLYDLIRYDDYAALDNAVAGFRPKQ
jgi:methylisocitrate lyase